MQSARAPLRNAIVLCLLALRSTQPAVAQSNADPCERLTQTEVSAATGTTMGAGHAVGETCNWTGIPRIIVSLWYPGPGMWQAIQHPKAAVKQSPAAGLGDAAFYDSAGGFTSLGVVKGSTAFVVKVYGIADQARQMSIEKALAANILAKL